MARAKKSTARLRAKKRIRKAAKGAFLGRSKQLRAAKENLDRGKVYAFRDRRRRKREFRSLWIIRIQAACRRLEISYSRFMRGLKLAQIDLDRKALADVAVTDPAAFERLVTLAREKAAS